MDATTMLSDMLIDDTEMVFNNVCVATEHTCPRACRNSLGTNGSPTCCSTPSSSSTGSVLEFGKVQRKAEAQKVMQKQVSAWSRRDSDQIPGMISVERDSSFSTSSSSVDEYPPIKFRQGLYKERMLQSHSTSVTTASHSSSTTTGTKEPSSLEIYGVIVKALRRNRVAQCSNTGTIEIMDNGKDASSLQSNSHITNMNQLSTLNPNTRLKLKRSSGTKKSRKSSERVTDYPLMVNLGVPQRARYSGEVTYVPASSYNNIMTSSLWSGPSNEGTAIPNGMGVLRFENGDFYIGEMQNGSMNGNGTLVYADKKIVKGIFDRNRFIC